MRSPAPLSAVIEPVAVRFGTLKEYAVGGVRDQFQRGVVPAQLELAEPALRVRQRGEQDLAQVARGELLAASGDAAGAKQAFAALPED